MDIQKLLEIRKLVEERINQLQQEIKLYTALLEFLDKSIGEKSFSTAAQVARPEFVEEIKGRSGEIYATAEIYRDYIYIKFREPVKIDSLFKRFFLDKFLQKYRDEDMKEARQGRGEEVLRYEIEEGGQGEAVALKIYNYKSEERRREILRVLRWTLEKVYA